MTRSLTMEQAQEDVKYYVSPIASPMAKDKTQKKILKMTKKRTHKNHFSLNTIRSWAYPNSRAWLALSSPTPAASLPSAKHGALLFRLEIRAWGEKI